MGPQIFSEQGPIKFKSGTTVPLFDALVRGESPHPCSGTEFGHRKVDSIKRYRLKSGDYLTWAWFGTGTNRDVTDRQTDGQTYDS